MTDKELEAHSQRVVADTASDMADTMSYAMARAIKKTFCKHDWHFTNDNTMAMRCVRCGTQTPELTPGQLAQDLLRDVATMGSAWSVGGKRIDPKDVYLPEIKFHVPPKPVGVWVLDPTPGISGAPCTMFHVFRKPTNEQIENTERMFGWEWRDLP